MPGAPQGTVRAALGDRICDWTGRSDDAYRFTPAAHGSDSGGKMRTRVRVISRLAGLGNSLSMSGIAHDRHRPGRDVVLLILAALAAASFLRGLTREIQSTAAPYWFINYRDGFVRRALLGHLFGLFVDQRDPARVLPAAMGVHLTACAILVLGLLCWLRVAPRQGGALGCAAFALFAGSQFLPTLAYDAGFLDVYDYLLVLAAAAAVINGRAWLAGGIGFAGPFLHEGFVFVWLTLVVMEIWRARGPRKAAFLITPFVALVLVYFLPSAEAGVAQMSRAPLPPEMKDLFIAYQFNQTLSESLRIMAWKFTYNFPSFLMAAVFFGFPAAVSVIAAALTFKSKRDSLAVALATLAPASILIVGWDLSRFLVATAFANMLCILFMRTLRPAAPPSRSVIAGCWVVGSVCFLQPLVYAHFQVASVKTDAPVNFAHMPIGAAVISWVAFYSRDIGPRMVPDVGDEDPPGNVWREEEDAWLNVWTRRPGTNIFDAVGQKGGITMKCTLRITRGGDRVRVVRTSCDDGNNLMYQGVIAGSEVRGTYPGGVWHAWIER